jgi:poly-gamma-glutamate synthase PgsB/CapB
MMAVYFLFVLFLILIFLQVEVILHKRRLGRIPIRIHVNGSRGKSSVTRLIAEALRRSNIRTLAKVTGDEPLLILPDGYEQKIVRRGPARIQEQLWFVRIAAGLKAEAIVVECMAIAPDLQSVAEERMISSTIGVITNVRPDHFEVMGDNLDEIALSLSRTIPRRAFFITADHNYFPFFAQLSEKKNTEAVLAKAFDDPSIPALPAAEHRSILCEVCKKLNLALPETNPGDFLGRDKKLMRLTTDAIDIYFLDAFSANDPESTSIIESVLSDTPACPHPYVAMLNNRIDRPLRMTSFVAYLLDNPRYDAIALAGDLSRIAFKRLHSVMPNHKKIWILEAMKPESVIEEICRELACRQFTLVGMGNAKGLGIALSGLFQKKGV